MEETSLTLWTIGHSTRTLQEFLALLSEDKIQTLADVRHFPGSRRFPYFSKESLARELPPHGISYEHLVELGGRRPARKDSHNLAWRNASFRGYADYMETPPFQTGIERLLTLAQRGRTVFMCSEALWWRCHRSLIADWLKSRGMCVLHILGPRKVEEHPYTSAAHVVNGRLSYENHAAETPLFQEDSS